jgi:hypothetical protein
MLIATGCTPIAIAPPAVLPPPAAAALKDAAFNGLAEAWLAETLRLDPIAATQAGEHRYDQALPDISGNGRAARLQLAQRTLAQLGWIDRSRLSRPAQVDAAVLENQLRFDIFQIERLQEHAWNPLGSSQRRGGWSCCPPGWPKRAASSFPRASPWSMRKPLCGRTPASIQSSTT